MANLKIKIKRLAEKSGILRGRADFAHVINPFKCSRNNASYLYYAQPVTFRSMKEAAMEAGRHGIDVQLYSINFPEDDSIVPGYFYKLPHLRRSTRSEFPEITQRKLPFVNDILESVYRQSNANHIVFTNSDIGLQKSFYIKAMELAEGGLEAFVINRRDNLPKFINGRKVSEDDLDLIYLQPGEPHIGFDCFVFRRELAPELDLGKLFTGFPPWGNVFKRELERKAENFDAFTDLHETFHLGRDLAWRTKTKHPLWIQNIYNARTLGYEYKI